MTANVYFIHAHLILLIYLTHPLPWPYITLSNPSVLVRKKIKKPRSFGSPGEKECVCCRRKTIKLRQRQQLKTRMNVASRETPPPRRLRWEWSGANRQTCLGSIETTRSPAPNHNIDISLAGRAGRGVNDFMSQ
jgi:hypothetical protein